MGPSAITNFPAADYEGEALDGGAEGSGEQVGGLRCVMPLTVCSLGAPM